MTWSQEPVAGPVRTDADVVANAPLTGSNRKLVLRVAAWPGFAPGQFVMLSPGARTAVERSDPLLPRPMAVYRAAAGNGSADVEIVYKVTGRGTALLAEALPGQRVRIVGPLGRAFPPPAPGERAVLVGGGTGIASLYELAARLQRGPLAQGAAAGRSLVLLGARSADDLMGREDFASLDVELRVATEDGSAGSRGLVTELLDAVLADVAAARVYACGPTPMMQRAAGIAAARARPCSVSLENVMACGFGVCLGCAAPLASGGYALVCRDGPMFDAGRIGWERLP